MELAPIFDGEYDLYKKIYLSLYSFTRKIQRVQMMSNDLESTLKDNVDGLMVEPITPLMAVSN